MPSVDKPRESRTLLSDYYGLQRAGSHGPEDSSSDDKDDFFPDHDDVVDPGPDSPASSDPLDREDFETGTYIHDLISKSTVKELIEMDNTLTGEIRTLDNDLQMLVYENYAKFITATDIIKEMQVKVNNLHADMTKLRLTTDTLGNFYTAAEQVIDPSRSEIERLLGLSRLVGRLNFLFDLPDRLRTEIAKRNYSQVVAMFTSSAKILKRENFIKSFTGIRKESEQILKDFKLQLRSELQSYENAKGAQSISIATLLLKLDEDPSLLWHDLFSSKRDWFLISLERAKKNNNSPGHLLKSLRMCFTDDFVEFTSQFRTVFLPSLSASAPSPVANQKAKVASRTIQDDAEVALHSFARQVFAMYLEDARTALMNIVDDFSSSRLSADERRVQLEVLVNEVKSLVGVVEAVCKAVPASQLGTRYKETTDAVIKRTILSVFTQCHRNVLESVVTYVRDASPITIPPSDKCINQIHEYLKSASLEVNLICTYHPQPDKLIQELFLDALGSVQALLLGDNRVLTTENAVQISAQRFEISRSLASAVKNVTPLILLRLSKLCTPCQGFVLPELFEFLAGLFPSLSASPAFNKKCAMLVQSFKEAEKSLANAAARQAGKEMSLSLMRNNDGMPGVPIRPSERIVAWKGAVSEFQLHLSALYPYSAVESHTRHPVTPSRPMRRNDIHRMFSQNHTTPVFVNVEPGFESLLHSSIKIAFKAWIEYARLNSFTAGQFQQTQIDVYFARVSIPACLGPNRSILDSLLDEVLTSTMDTCLGSSSQLSPELVEQYGSAAQ